MALELRLKQDFVINKYHLLDFHNTRALRMLNDQYATAIQVGKESEREGKKIWENHERNIFYKAQETLQEKRKNIIFSRRSKLAPRMLYEKIHTKTGYFLYI